MKNIDINLIKYDCFYCNDFLKNCYFFYKENKIKFKFNINIKLCGFYNYFSHSNDFWFCLGGFINNSTNDTVLLFYIQHYYDMTRNRFLEMFNNFSYLKKINEQKIIFNNNLFNELNYYKNIAKFN